ncbi:hypothetical protein J542_3966, partial [Acinetobacter baumannii 299505]
MKNFVKRKDKILMRNVLSNFKELVESSIFVENITKNTDKFNL